MNTSRENRVGWPLFLPLALAALVPMGCGGGKGDISGEVKILGRGQLPSGEIVFQCQGGNKPVIRGPIHDGKYTLNNVPPGAAVITVETYPLPPHRPVPRGPHPSDKVPERPAKPAGKYVPANKKYASPDTSGLTCDVKVGEQIKNIDLEP